MIRSWVSFVFFANYFVGILAVALSVETAFQLNIPLHSAAYYGLLFCATVMYYTKAYAGASPASTSANPRTEWYRTHARFVRISQAVLLMLCTGLISWILFQDFTKIIRLPFHDWLLLVTVLLSALLYYGLLPKSLISFNLRNTGWFKAFVIGFVWAGCVNIFPVTMVRIEHSITIEEPVLMVWLFLKNWMFCTINAIMFDIKDYEDDANIQLKTFVVKFGLPKTISYVLVPLLLVGLLSFLIFAMSRHFSYLTISLNLIPFLCLLWVAFSLHKPKKILFYLIVIDGLLLVKAICGIAGILLA